MTSKDRRALLKEALRTLESLRDACNGLAPGLVNTPAKELLKALFSTGSKAALVIDQLEKALGEESILDGDGSERVTIDLPNTDNLAGPWIFINVLPKNIAIQLYGEMLGMDEQGQINIMTPISSE